MGDIENSKYSYPEIDESSSLATFTQDDEVVIPCVSVSEEEEYSTSSDDDDDQFQKQSNEDASILSGMSTISISGSDYTCSSESTYQSSSSSTSSSSFDDGDDRYTSVPIIGMKLELPIVSSMSPMVKVKDDDKENIVNGDHLRVQGQHKVRKQLFTKNKVYDEDHERHCQIRFAKLCNPVIFKDKEDDKENIVNGDYLCFQGKNKVRKQLIMEDKDHDEDYERHCQIRLAKLCNPAIFQRDHDSNDSGIWSDYSDENSLCDSQYSFEPEKQHYHCNAFENIMHFFPQNCNQRGKKNNNNAYLPVKQAILIDNRNNEINSEGDYYENEVELTLQSYESMQHRVAESVY